MCKVTVFPDFKKEYEKNKKVFKNIFKKILFFLNCFQSHFFVTLQLILLLYLY